MKQCVVILAVLGLSLAAPGLDGHHDHHIPYPFHPSIGGRIVGGVVADIHELPFQVALLRNGAQICGGALIGPRTVLTAAHCVAPSVISSITQLNIRSGSSLHSSGGLRVAARQIIIHPRYEDCAWCEPDNDIAVIELAEDAIAPGIPSAPIGLWDDHAHFPQGTYATVSGWGTTSEGGFGSSQLRKVDVPIVDRIPCSNVYGSIISQRTICAGYPEGGKDSCQGDSGGPFVIDGKLAGIVSFGYGCARAGFPGVYSSVPGYREWIRENAHI